MALPAAPAESDDYGRAKDTASKPTGDKPMPQVTVGKVFDRLKQETNGGTPGTG